MVGRESGQTSAWSFMARELDQSLYAGKQMTAIGTNAQAAVTEAGAPARAEQMWLQTNWPPIMAEVRRLQEPYGQNNETGLKTRYFHARVVTLISLCLRLPLRHTILLIIG
jgi:hypothetical protein